MPESSIWILVSIPAILVALTFHEYAHGLVADMLGDPTPRNSGRLTLNPLAHLDLLGTLLLILAKFGWAKPVPVNPFYFRMDRQKGMMLVAVAGPLMNLIIGYLSAVAMRFVGSSLYAYQFLEAMLVFNVYLAIFNLVPIPPLDGSRVLAGVVSREAANFIYQLEVYGPFLLLLLIATGIIAKVVGPAASWALNNILWLSGLGF